MQWQFQPHSVGLLVLVGCIHACLSVLLQLQTSPAASVGTLLLYRKLGIAPKRFHVDWHEPWQSWCSSDVSSQVFLVIVMTMPNPYLGLVVTPILVRPLPKLVAVPQLNSGHYINPRPRTSSIVSQPQAWSNPGTSDLSPGLDETPNLVWPLLDPQLYYSSILDATPIPGPGLPIPSS